MIRPRRELLRFLDFKAKDMVYYFVLSYAVFAFYKQTNSMLAEMVATNKYLLGASTNSDLWHTKVTGKTFKQGAPIEYLDVIKARNLFDADNAHAQEGP